MSMYMSFKDFLLCVLKALILTFMLAGLYGLVMYNYKLGIAYCNFLNIPKDLAFSVVSPGMAVEVSLLLLVIELVGFYLVTKFLRISKYINNLFNFLSFEY
ncbi:MAG: hypothetical protein J6D03_02515 [Clostridia bacterium]|nr:hypothetical protein [Clostridia bacterium]MBO5530529.1 hypothetical protein [Bacilli bacterium]